MVVVVVVVVSLCFQPFLLVNLAAPPLILFISATTSNFSRHDFPLPPHFVFGSGTSAYQVEGAAFEDGRTFSIWDTFAHAGNEGATGDIACDSYHKYKEDIQLMVETGLEAYRFSISLPRLIPNGRGAVNPKGLEYYNNLINELIRHGIQPHATLVHYDLPQALEDEYGGCLSPKFVKDFMAYTEVCFREFGNRVLYWTTFNEVNVFVLGGYDVGITPPKRCSFPFGINCSKGNSSSEPYIVAHNILLAHASAANLYKKKYQGRQQGFIGINVFAYWYIPSTDATEDVIATQRANDFYIGWIINPLVFGDYPKIVKKNAGSRIQEFTKVESKLVKGQQTRRNSTLHDSARVKYLHGFIGSLLDAVRNGSNARGYFTWSFLDVYELLDGYGSCFGLYYVDLDDKDLKRYPKLSAHWYSNFLKGRSSIEVENISALSHQSHFSQ
ncbi:putative beta-glucosidase 23 [Camellia lanceoleosa]|uniref:Beta-glucosidase 23 n=1 Tax=Camellia lanceoleosa TaxID=1840588 RepID=A0ACC0FUM2_9ERIC|nr:putative beta-glucosidase 23 [Camellia lanceoleosa]